MKITIGPTVIGHLHQDVKLKPIIETPIQKAKKGINVRYEY